MKTTALALLSCSILVFVAPRAIAQGSHGSDLISPQSGASNSAAKKSGSPSVKGRVCGTVDIFKDEVRINGKQAPSTRSEMYDIPLGESAPKNSGRIIARLRKERLTDSCFCITGQLQAYEREGTAATRFTRLSKLDKCPNGL